MEHLGMLAKGHSLIFEKKNPREGTGGLPCLRLPALFESVQMLRTQERLKKKNVREETNSSGAPT